MILAAKKLLSEKKGVAEGLGMFVMVMTLAIGVGALLASYAVHSKSAAQMVTMQQEITNRAEGYAAALNLDLVNPQMPSLARECVVATEVCTQIMSTAASDDGESVVLRIQGDAVALLGATVTRDVTLKAVEVTHVTGVDEDGNNIWGLADEGLRYKTWGVASGKPSNVTPAEITKDPATWTSVSDRAGVDSRGDLWVWGANEKGQAGNGASTEAPIEPVRITAEGTKFRTVNTLDDRGYAIDSQGFAWVWGNNRKGQLGEGAAVIDVPTKLRVRVNSIVGGLDSTVAITTSGELWVQGTTPAGLPAPNADGIVNKGTQYRSVAANAPGNSIALVDASGRLQVLSTKFSFTPLASDPAFAQVAMGYTHGAALTVDGRLFTFGTAADGALGQGTKTTSREITEVMPGTKFVSIAATHSATFAVTATGKVFYAGRTDVEGSADYALPRVSKFTELLPNSTFRMLTSNPSRSTLALLDSAGNLYGLGTSTAGLWPMDYLGAKGQPVRMPKLDAFSS